MQKVNVRELPFISEGDLKIIQTMEFEAPFGEQDAVRIQERKHLRKAF